MLRGYQKNDKAFAERTALDSDGLGLDRIGSIKLYRRICYCLIWLTFLLCIGVANTTNLLWSSLTHICLMLTVGQCSFEFCMNLQKIRWLSNVSQCLPLFINTFRLLFDWFIQMIRMRLLNMINKFSRRFSHSL